MENFNIKRFGRTLKWYLAENRQRLLYWSLGLALGIFALETFILYITVGHLKGVQVDTVSVLAVVPFCAFIISIAVALAWSNIFATLRGKQQRITFLTLPATNAERYTAALVVAVVVWPLCILLAIILGDTLRYVLFGILGKGWASGLAAFFEATYNELLPASADIKVWLLNLSSSFWFCSLFILGGTWLRKHPFLITGFFITMLFFIFTYLVVHFGEELTLLLSNADRHIESTHRVYPTIAVLTILGIANFTVSYQLFRRFQLITSKWTNV